MPAPTTHHRGKCSRSRLGRALRPAFTLLETMLALVIIGVGVLAFVDAQQSFLKANGWSSQAATGMLLANEVREMVRRLPRHDSVTGLTLVGSGPSANLIGWGREASEITIDDIDDVDDLDGITFGEGGDYDGPVDAFGGVVPQIDPDGTVVMANGEPLPLRDWRQRVTVEKVDPYNFNTVRAGGYTQTATSQFPAIAVDKFPLRVTVIVEHLPAGQSQYEEITRVTWVVSP